jgi:outer membrane lipoprotein carrier protein
MSRRARHWLATLVVCLAQLIRAEASEAQTAPIPAPSPSPPPSSSADQLVASVQALYNTSSTFQSDFEQKFWVKAYNTEKASHGHVTFAKPGKMDWVYADPENNRIVSDGSVIRIYQASDKQMYEEPADKSQYLIAVSFLTGTGKLSDAFDFELFPGDKMKFPGGAVLVGTPKQATPAYSKVLFYVDSATSQVRRVMVIDGQGNRNRFDFVNPKINHPIGPNQFKFTPPPGTSIVRP